MLLELFCDSSDLRNKIRFLLHTFTMHLYISLLHVMFVEIDLRLCINILFPTVPLNHVFNIRDL